MEIEVQGGTKTKRMLVLGLASILADRLKIKNSKKYLLILLHKDFRGDGVHSLDGCTNYQDEGVLVVINASLKQEKLMTILAHEMVHVKQICKGQLKFTSPDVTYWRGKEYITKEHEYLDTPWEIEAFQQQELLIRRIATALN